MSMIAALLVSLMSSPSAHAGWLRTWCAKNLVTDDPYQFEEVTDAWLDARIARLEARHIYRMLLPEDQREYELLKRERESRVRIAELIRDARAKSGEAK